MILKLLIIQYISEFTYLVKMCEEMGDLLPDIGEGEKEKTFKPEEAITNIKQETVCWKFYHFKEQKKQGWQLCTNVWNQNPCQLIH